MLEFFKNICQEFDYNLYEFKYKKPFQPLTHFNFGDFATRIAPTRISQSVLFASKFQSRGLLKGISKTQRPPSPTSPSINHHLFLLSRVFGLASRL